MLGMDAPQDAVEALRQQLGLNAPLLVRYFHWIGGMLVGNFGRSYTYSVPVFSLVKDRIGVSLPLAIIALVLSTAIALPVGVAPVNATMSVPCRSIRP